MKKRYTILLCDDDEFISRMYAYRLEVEGYKVVIVNSGEKVIPKLKEIKPDLVILDLMMPVKNGFEILQELQRDSDNTTLKRIPVVVASNLSQQTDIATVRNLGAVDFVIKLDTAPKEMIEKVQKYLPNT